MARKKLNKKVALIGSVFFAFLVLAAILLFLYWSQDPEKFIKDGDAAVKAGDAAIDKEIKAEEYKKAANSYHRARKRAKDDSLRVDILFKLVDVYLKGDKWKDVMGCWNQIVRIDPKNTKARFGRLKYVYIIAENYERAGIDAPGVWKEIESQASEFIEVADADVLADDTAKWEFFWKGQRAVAERIGPYLYLLRGKAVFEITKMGAVTNPDESLARAIADLEKVRELEPANIDACWYLAEAFIKKGDILALRGNPEERDKAVEHAQQLLAEAVAVAGDDPRAHINVTRMKLQIMMAQKTSREQIQTLETEYLSLAEKFDSSAEVFSALAGFYRILGYEKLDEAIKAIEKAIELDPENVAYAIAAANLHYRRFSIYGQNSELYKAIEIARNALTLRGAQDKPGPQQTVNRNNRILLYMLLADCYIEQVLEPCEVRTEAQKQQWLTNAEQAVHEIEQLFDSGEEPQVIKWQGMLDLARGDRNSAVKKMYMTYEQFKSIDEKFGRGTRKDPLLSYRLAKLFENTTELGVASEFFASALSPPDSISVRKPEALLDFADVLLKRRVYDAALNVVNSFEANYWNNQRSQTLRIKAYIGAGQFDEAEQELTNIPPNDPNTIKLNFTLVQAKIVQIQRDIARRRMEETSDALPGAKKEDAESQQASVRLMKAQLDGYNDTLAGLLGKLLEIEPNSIEEASITTVCNSYIVEGKMSKAADLVDLFLVYFPDNITALLYKQLLSEPEPSDISQQRRREIEQQVLLGISDPVRRAVNLGAFYWRINEPNEAAREFKEVLKIEAAQDDAVEETEEMTPSQRLAASYLFDIALGTKDWELAGQIEEMARRENIDDCEGNFFTARIAMAKEQYKDALARLDECLKQRPVFSLGLMLRSRANAALGNEHKSIEDARKAASLNPLDGTIAKILAGALYQRNRKLGNNVSTEQVVEAKNALRNAIRLNPGELQLQSFYAEYVSEENPANALAIRQYLQKIIPSMENAILLGKLATKMGLDETDAERKEALFAIAASSFEQAIAIEPQNRVALGSYAEYYRLAGQGKKAEELLRQSQDQKLLWHHYFRSGQLDDAKRVLEQLYQTGAKDSNVVRGLLLVAERTADKEAAKKYSEELLLLEESIENHLLQIQTFLKIGLVKEAEYRLQSFKEKYSDEFRALLLEAWLAMKQGQLKNALELTSRSLEVNQDNAMAWRLRGEVNRLMANYVQAIDDLKRSKSLSDEPATRIALARTYHRAGQEEDAIIELKNTIDHPQAPLESRTLLEQIYLQLGRKDALKRFYNETLEKFPDNVLWYNRAGAFAIAQSDFSRAEQLYGQAWQKDKEYGRSSATAFDGYLQALLLGGKLDKVSEEAHEYVDSDFAPIAFIRMAEVKLKLGDKASAIQYCRKAVDKAGTNGIFVSDILQRMCSLLETQEALKLCRQKLQANPDSLAANYIMFNLTRISGEYNKAVGYIDKCLQIMGPDSPRRVGYVAQRAQVLQLAYNKTSDNSYLKKAITEYESLLAKVPNNENVLNNLAYALAENNERLPDALRFAERAHKAKPNNPYVMDTYSYVLYKNGRFPEAAEFLQAALQQYEQDRISAPAEVYEHLGMIKEELGAADEAIAAYKQALEVGIDELSAPAKERINKAIERLSP